MHSYSSIIKSLQASWLILLFTPTHIHVENAVKDFQTIEVEDAEPEFQEEQQPEYVVADQDLEQDYTNFETQQGKPRCILTRVLTSIESLMQYNLCIKFIGVDLIPSCMR